MLMVDVSFLNEVGRVKELSSWDLVSFLNELDIRKGTLFMVTCFIF